MWEITEEEPVEKTITKRRWRWFGYTLRKPRKNTASPKLQYAREKKKQQTNRHMEENYLQKAGSV